MQKKILHLSKKLIINLPIFMDVAVDTLSNFTTLEAKKTSHEIREFDANLDGIFISASMKFKGDINGSFVLIFPREIAIITLEAILSEKVDANDFDTLKDGVGEFCNIVLGSIKTAFSKKDINITFALPQTYSSLKSIKGSIGTEKGIWVNMSLSKKPFYMFIGT